MLLATKISLAVLLIATSQAMVGREEAGGILLTELRSNTRGPILTSVRVDREESPLTSYGTVVSSSDDELATERDWLAPEGVSGEQSPRQHQDSPPRVFPWKLFGLALLVIALAAALSALIAVYLPVFKLFWEQQFGANRNHIKIIAASEGSLWATTELGAKIPASVLAKDNLGIVVNESASTTELASATELVKTFPAEAGLNTTFVTASVVEFETETRTELETGIVVETSSELVTDVVSDPITETSSELVTDISTEITTNPVIETSSELVTDPTTTELVTNPITETVTNPITETVTETTTETIEETELENTTPEVVSATNPASGPSPATLEASSGTAQLSSEGSTESRRESSSVSPVTIPTSTTPVTNSTQPTKPLVLSPEVTPQIQPISKSSLRPIQDFSNLRKITVLANSKRYEESRLARTEALKDLDSHVGNRTMADPVDYD